MLAKIDNFLKSTKILRVPAGLLAGYVFIKVFAFLYTVASVLDAAV